MLRFKTDGRIFDYLNISVPILMGIFLFFNPFSHTTAIKEICFYLSVFIVLVLTCSKKTEFSFKSPLALPFVLFVIWAFIGLFFALYKENSIHDFYSHLLKYIVLYYILINFFRSKKSLVGLSWIVIISSTVFSVGGIIYFYFILENILSERFIGFAHASVNIIGVTSVFSMILSLNNLLNETNFYRKTILIVCFFLVFISLGLSQMRSAFIPLCLAIIILFINNKKALVALLVIILISVSFSPLKSRFIPPYNLLILFRVGINYQTYEIIKDYPIAGIGFGMETYKNAVDLKTYHERVPDEYRENYIYDDPHNMFFDIAVRTGLVGFVLFLYIIFAFFKICWCCIKNGNDDFIKNWGRCIIASFFSFLFIGFFHPVFSHMPEVILCTIFAMMTILWRLNAEDGAGKRQG